MPELDPTTNGEEGTLCCTGEKGCCGPGSVCCKNAGPHTHDVLLEAPTSDRRPEKVEDAVALVRFARSLGLEDSLRRATRSGRPT